jgi:hypothetical protein
MNRPGFYIAAAAGLLLLSGTLAAGPESYPPGLDMDATVADSRELPAWHPPVLGFESPGPGQPELPEGHPPISDLVVCPVTGAIGMPQESPMKPVKAVEGLVRI